MDVIVDLQYGDCGKGKVAHFLCTKGQYTHVLRYNGGCNAGHTIFHKGVKFVTHHIPAGVFAGIPSVIGPGCVVDPEKFLAEVQGLEDGGIPARKNVFIAKNAHVITKAHKAEDGADTTVGTTGQGNGPAYRDKFARIGLRAENVPELEPFLVDLYDLWYGGAFPATILAEGAQGFGLDIDWGDYPFVTSSHCTVGGAILNGIPFSAVRDVWGVAKMYETYVGKKKFQPEGDVFDKIGDAGEEYGATTGRRRQVNWMNMQLLERAILMNGVTHVVFNKVDVLRQVGAWAVVDNDVITPFSSEEAMKSFVSERLAALDIPQERVFFSESKEGL